MKTLISVIESILDANYDVAEEDLNTIFAHLKDIKVYPTKDLQCALTGVDFNNDHLKDLKKALQKNLPIGPSVEKHLPAEYKPGKKAECIGQIIYWILCQDYKDPEAAINEVGSNTRFDKEVLTTYGSKTKNYGLFVEDAWGEFYVHLTQTDGDDPTDFTIMKFSLK